MIGKIIKEERNKTGLSQEQLAEQVGVSRSAIAKWENDLCIPDIDNIIILCNIFEVSVDYLLSPLLKKKDEEIFKVSIAEKRNLYKFEVVCSELLISLIALAWFIVGQVRLEMFGNLGGISDMIYGCICFVLFTVVHSKHTRNLQDKYYPKPNKLFLFIYNMVRKIKKQNQLQL